MRTMFGFEVAGAATTGPTGVKTSPISPKPLATIEVPLNLILK